jgi:hypothetical protein
MNSLNAKKRPHKLAWIVLLSAPLGCSSVADELSDFTSDGCSAFPEGTIEQKQLWHSCCVVHDLAYWKGGNADERKAADLALKVCVAEVGEPGIAKLMLAGVRVGGTPWLPTRFRWAYGWPYLRGYKEAEDGELLQIELKTMAATELLRAQRAELEGDN